MEDKKDKKIRLLNQEIDRLNKENEQLCKENIELNDRVNNLINVYNSGATKRLQEYEEKMISELNDLRKLKSLYQEAIKKYKVTVSKERARYKKATNKAITAFNKSLS